MNRRARIFHGYALRWTLVVLALLCLVLGWLFAEFHSPARPHEIEMSPVFSNSSTLLPEPDPIREPPPDRTPNEDVPPTTDAESAGSRSVGNSAIERAERAARMARADRAAARSALSAAESEMDETEQKIEALESFIEDLEQQGEDPADHAEEGMKRFNPVFDEYERRMQQIVDAEAAEEEATARLREAETSIEALRLEARSPTAGTLPESKPESNPE